MRMINSHAQFTPPLPISSPDPAFRGLLERNFVKNTSLKSGGKDSFPSNILAKLSNASKKQTSNLKVLPPRTFVTVSLDSFVVV